MTLDGGSPVNVDLYSAEPSAAARAVWNTGAREQRPHGHHRLYRRQERRGDGTTISVDAFDIWHRRYRRPHRFDHTPICYCRLVRLHDHRRQEAVDAPTRQGSVTVSFTGVTCWVATAGTTLSKPTFARRGAATSTGPPAVASEQSVWATVLSFRSTGEDPVGPATRPANTRRGRLRPMRLPGAHPPSPATTRPTPTS